MINLISDEDILFKEQVETCEFSVSLFDHSSHLRLAYIYLLQSNNTDDSVILMREALTGLLKHVRIEPSTKYHETLTEAWVLAVHHFLNKTEHSTSANNFIEQHPEMLNSNIMLTHYSAEVLFSEEARQSFVEPNLDPIPRYGG
ncbi:MAG: hypothetical protein COA74_15980 [Gammaproteobacteria bacterium]|nr:MAG: hypothetical protein COA74_15980 [Gammaproteobacteria bacterium]